MHKLPRWADVILIPLISLVLAGLISALVIFIIADVPEAATTTLAVEARLAYLGNAVNLMVTGALGSSYGWGYTLYYATNFMFTGLAVAVAFHARIFNIGGEGQAALGGLGVALVSLYIPWPHWTLALIGGALGGAIFGALWITLPAYLSAKRGSHIVITTIMFNFMAYGLLNFVLNEYLRPVGRMDPASANFPVATHLPSLGDIAGAFGIDAFGRSPANITFLVAILACVGVWLLIWRSRLGYEIRALGHSESAAKYAGIDPVKITMIVLLLSGALAGMMAINNVMGEAERLVLNSVEGAGFIGIAVALMGRNHPFGVFVAAVLFGFLYQGGAELALWTTIPREMIVVIQALVIMFTGALDNMVRVPLARLFALFRRQRGAAPDAAVLK